MIKLLIPAVLATVCVSTASYAQTACGRAIMLAGQTITQTKNSTTIAENEVRMKKMLEKECEIDLAKERDTQSFAQKRIDARTAWNTMRHDMRACLNDTGIPTPFRLILRKKYASCSGIIRKQ